MTSPSSAGAKYSGLPIRLPALGEVRLTQVLAATRETQLYLTDHPGVVAQMFDLWSGRPDEITYGPYMSFTLELQNFEAVLALDALTPYVPAYYGAHVDYAAQYACIAMEFLEGQNLKDWSVEGLRDPAPLGWLEEFHVTVYEAFSILRLFHRQGILLIDFKPDNIIRLADGRIKFVDLGALFTARHARDLSQYVYSATPDHAEVLIDASNLQSGLAPTETADVFAAGVALFELATGSSRLAVDGETADGILASPEVYRFRDSQIRDVWRAFPHLRESLPLIETQLKERAILFADLWPLLKGLVAHRWGDWEALASAQQDQVVLTTGTTFILEQLPAPLQWLAGPIAQATVLRSLRSRNMGEWLRLLADPVPEAIQEDLRAHNWFRRYLLDLGQAADGLGELNRWDARRNPRTGHWAIAAPFACRQLPDAGQFTFLKRTDQDEQGDRYFQIVGELEADCVGGEELALAHLRADRRAWLG